MHGLTGRMRHSYSTDSKEHKYIPLFLAASAIAAAFLTAHIMKRYQIELPWWASPPVDTMALYGAFYLLFDRIFWKWNWVHSCCITRIPDLSGKWHGQVKPVKMEHSSSDLPTASDITVDIQQTWTEILITAEAEFSNSHSLSGHLIISDGTILTYEYINEPVAHAPSTMHMHRGTARLILTDKGLALSGDYYSGRDRQNVGTIHLTRGRG
jgi:hypothetical protein